MRKIRLPLGLAAFALLAAACVPTEAAQQTGFAPDTGMPPDAVISIQKTHDVYSVGPLFFVLFSPEKATAAQIAAAPTRLCTSIGRKLSLSEFMGHGQEPGTALVRKMMVRCT